MTTIWYTADMHFGHANIIKYCNRPFDSVDEMDYAMIRAWNDRVQPEDTVYVLGDLALGDFKVSMERTTELVGRRVLVPGNHDRCFLGAKNPDQRAYLDAGWEIAPQISSSGYLSDAIDSIVVMSHFPYEGDSHDADRFEKYRPDDEGFWLLHGHIHDKWKVKDKQINVGVDVWDFAPVSADTLLLLMK